MTKADLIESLSNTADLPKGQAERVVNAVFDGIVAALRKGDKVTLSGFGTFQVSERKARTGRNPQTGASIKISAKKVVRFKPGKELSESVNKKGK